MRGNRNWCSILSCDRGKNTEAWVGAVAVTLLHFQRNDMFPCMLFALTRVIAGEHKWRNQEIVPGMTRMGDEER